MILHLLGTLLAAGLFYAGTWFPHPAAIIFGALMVIVLGSVLSFAQTLERYGFKVPGDAAYRIGHFVLALEKLAGLGETAAALPLYISDTQIVPVTGIFLAQINGVRSVVIEGSMNDAKDT